MRSRNTYGEALIALVGLAGFIGLIWTGAIDSWSSVWLFTGILGIIIVFYFLLLLAKAIHLFMTGGDSFWWEKYEEERKPRNGKRSEK